MKNALYILLCLLPVVGVAQQNHVPNGSFEYYSQCPNGGGMVSCSGWYHYSGSQNYFHRCGSGGNSVPNTFLGYQQPAHGNAFIGGFHEFNNNGGAVERTATSIIPLSVGTLYEVSMSVVLCYGPNSSNKANAFGAMFFKDGDTMLTRAGAALPKKPQIHYTNYPVIQDTQNWVRLIGAFVADSAYDHIVIGGFDPSDTSFGWYFIDDVVVKAVDSISYQCPDTVFCVGDTIVLPYYVNGKYSINDTLTFQLSDAAGDFSSPVNITQVVATKPDTVKWGIPNTITNGGNYRLRVITTTTPVDTFYLNGVSLEIGNIDSANISIAGNSPLCAGNDINLVASSNATATTYQWTGPNSFSSTSATPTLYNASTVHSGDYYAMLNFYGCEVKDTVAINVKPSPAKPVAINNSPFCAGAILKLNDTSSTAGLDFSWTGPNRFQDTTRNPIINNANTTHSGDYILTVYLNGCKATDTTTVVIKQSPSSVTLSSNSAICAGSTLQLNSTASSSGVTYAWTGPNSYTASTQNSSITNAMANRTGWYKMVVDLNGCTYEDSLYATVHPIPNSPTLSYNNPICLGETLNLTANTVAGATYSWTGVNSFTSSNQNPSKSNMQYSDTGVYKATVSVNGCVSPADSIRVVLNPNPFVTIISNPTDSICQGDPVLFTALANNHGGTPTHQWYVNSQPMGSGATYNTTGLNDKDIIKCVMVENTKCSVPYTDESNDIYMTVLPWLPPSVTITADKSQPLEKDEYITFTAHPVDAGANPEYQWKRNGNNISGATGGTWSANTLSDNDSISVEVISKYKCPQPPTASSNGIVVRVLAGVDDLGKQHKLSLYPNPNRGTFTVKGSLTTATNIDVVNAMGQVVYSTATQASSNGINHEISLPEVASGIYLLCLHTDAGVSVLRFTVK